MPQKNDLTAIKTVSKHTLVQADNSLNSNNANKPGRKEKPLAEKENQTVVLKLTLRELTHLKKQAGLVPLGTFLKHHLRVNTDLLQ